MTALTAAILMAILGQTHGGHGPDHAHGQREGGGRFGNPEDLAAYVARMEEPSRVEWQKPDEVLRALGVAAGQTVCDIGAGPGYFALRAAKMVGAKGQVYAIDVEPRILDVLRDRIAAAGVKNVTPVLALPADPLIPAACDLILTVDVYHHFPDGTAYLARLGRALRPGGRIAVIDFEKRETPVGPPVDHRVAREVVVKAAAAAGLTIAAEPKILPHQYFLILKPR
jgi:ubiquinone/menaquinone biosynthesis C-methylase UbiE